MHPVDWNGQGHALAKQEPRRGRRLTLAALVHIPQRPPLLVYSAHLEVLQITVERPELFCPDAAFFSCGAAEAHSLTSTIAFGVPLLTNSLELMLLRTS